MGNDIKYFVVKDTKDMSITYFEYDKVDGYDINPRNVKIKDAIDVKKMIVINPSMIEKLARMKVDSKMNKLIKIFMFVLSSDNDDDSGETYREVLNEAHKLRLEVMTKYKNKLKEEDSDLFNKKLDIIENEMKTRIMMIGYKYDYNMNQEKEGKSR